MTRVPGPGVALRLNVWITRCAWHRRYHGHTKLYKVARHAGIGLHVTDGLCRGCAAIFRKDNGLRPVEKREA